LRVDANGAWMPDIAARFCRNAAKFNLEYLEDPLPDDDDNAWVQLNKFRLPLGLDRMGQNIALRDALLNRRQCRALIVKPAAYGSLSVIADAALRAQRYDAELIFTGMYESSLGLAYIAHCAAAWGSRTLAHGLGTAELFAKDLLPAPLVPQSGQLALPDLNSIFKTLPKSVLETLGI
jgi:L-alanine-DL-glutamate epimerase-like enolase superfamily enzyme